MIKYKSIGHTIAAGHDGTVFSVSGIPRGEKIIEMYKWSYKKHRNKWSELTAREKAWEEVAERIGFKYGKS